MVEAKKVHLPVLVEKDEDGFFVVECPLLHGCYTEAVPQLVLAPKIFLLFWFRALSAFLFQPILNCWTASTQGKTLDEALKNIHEVIELCLEEQKEEIVEQLDTIREFSYHVVSAEI